MPHKAILILLLALLLVPFAAFAEATTAPAQKIDVERFSRLPVMHEGRIKPMDSFARSLKKQLSGTDHNAAAWLIEVLFNPARAEQVRSLKIINPDVLNMLEITRVQDKLYAYKDIAEALAQKQDILVSVLKTPDEDWTPAQRDFVILQQNTVLLGDLLAGMSLFLPVSATLPEDVPESLKPYAGQTLTYLDILRFQETLQQETALISRRKGEDWDSYTASEQAVTFLSFTFSNLQAAGRRSAVFKVIPAGAGMPWLSPWQTISGQGGPETTEAFNIWSDMARAYHEKKPGIWNQNVQEAWHLIHDAAGADIRPFALTLEYYYNRVHPFGLSVLLYGIAFLTLLGGASLKKRVHVFSAVVLAGAVLCHIAGIGARMFILQRPPVSTLYESIIFVAVIAALYGLIMFIKNREGFWLYLGAGCGLFLTLVSFTHDQDGDSFLMLSAVLNTNFWLATHVIVITLGYAFCLVSSVLAHYMLVKPSRTIKKHLHEAALVALLLSLAGTILGGIWADQSWGRFWGWDPKENGALLIVLWLVWILHGRISGQMKELFVTVTLAFLSVIVSLSWFGVNLLSVGLHAYGFTDAAAWGLGVFIACETLLIAGLALYGKRQRHHAA